jgi:cysteinyl-tRNA synthetase
MDYTKGGTDELGERYSFLEMSVIKDSGSRSAIAYLSIGEAEDYRWYFDSDWTDNGIDEQPDSDAPYWLCRTNPDWAGNYKVQYWSDAWQTIVLEYVDKIIKYGFDGVYLDIIDGFEYWSDPGNGEGYHLSEAEAADRMINFVKRIAAYGRAQNPAFLVIPQNGESILESAEKADYLAVINGIGIEDLFYDERTATTDSAYRMAYIDQVTAAGKPAIVVDYVYAGQDPPGDPIVQDFLDTVNAKSGYYPYAARTSRELDDLVIFTGQGE